MSARGSVLKEKLAAGQTTIGSWLSCYDPAIAEIMANLGFDWVIIDSEHAPFSLPLMENMLMAFNGTETTPLIRVPWNDPVMIKQALDIGPAGVLVPLVNSAEEARRAVAACKYPPEGVRGVSPRRASSYFADFTDYLARANDETIVTVQIEHIQAVESIDAILEVPGIDVALVGPADLTASLGLLPQFTHARVQEAIRKVLARCLERKVAFGIHTGSPSDARLWASRGAQFVAMGMDIVFLRQAALDWLAKFRSGA